jgi:hypothetical protein
MREDALLMKTLRAYFTDDEGIRGFQNIPMFPKGEVPFSTRIMRPSLPVVKDEKRGSPSKEGRKSWQGMRWR